MGISAGAAGLADLVGSLFFPAAADIGAADLGAVGAADLLGTAGAGAVEGGADIGVGALASGATAADLAAVGTGAAEGGSTALADVAPAAAALGTDLSSGALGTIGDTVGGAEQALAFPTTTGESAAAAEAAAQGSSLPGTTGLAGAIPDTTSGLVSPSQALAGDINIDTSVADASAGATGATEGTTAAPAAANTGAVGATPAGVTQAAGTPALTGLGNAETAGAAPLASTVQSEPLASLASEGQLAAEGGLASDAQSALASAGGPSFLNTLGNAGSALGKFASNPLVQLGVPAGVLAYNLIKGPAPIPPQAQQAIANEQGFAPGAINAATANVPLFNQTAAQDLTEANNFQISPAQAASLAIFQQDAENQLYQQLANQGITNPQSSTQFVQGKNQIAQQVEAQKVQMINQLIQTAFSANSAVQSAEGTASGIENQLNNTLMAAAGLQVQQDQAFAQSVGSALTAFGLIAGLQGSNIQKAMGLGTTVT